MEAQFNVQIVGDRTPGPGPADYVDRDRFGDGLKYSIRPRVMPKNETVDPALVNLPTCIGKGQKHSLSSRYDPPNPFVPPGPNYVAPSFGADATKIGFTKSRQRTKIKKSPGPADYSITPVAAKGFGTESPRTNIRTGGPRVLWDTINSPGPAVYKPRYMEVRASSPKYTISHKYKERKKDRTGEYIAPRSTLDGHGSTFSHGGRTPIFHIWSFIIIIKIICFSLIYANYCLTFFPG